MSRQCSRDHYRQLVVSGDAITKRDQLYVFMLRHQNHTRSELAQAIGWPINSICGRVKELIDDGAVLESGKRRECRVTGNQVHYLEALPADEMHQADMFRRAG